MGSREFWSCRWPLVCRYPLPAGPARSDEPPVAPKVCTRRMPRGTVFALRLTRPSRYRSLGIVKEGLQRHGSGRLWKRSSAVCHLGWER